MKLLNVFGVLDRVLSILLVLSVLLLTSSMSNAEEQGNYYPFKQHILGKNATGYKIITKSDNSYEITAIGNNSASGLYISDEKLRNFIPHYPIFEWSWEVITLQNTADIAIKGRDDYAASIQFLFGETGLLSRPKILSYSWVGNDAEVNSVIKSPRIPNNFRTIILENKLSPLKTKIMHKRNLHEDYKLAYGKYPDKNLGGFGIFTDNDQTNEDVKAIYYLKNYNK